MSRTVEKFTVSRIAPNLVRVDTEATTHAAEGSIGHASTFLIRGDRAIDIRNTFDPKGELPPLARIGVRLDIASGLEHLVWYGHGPHENYIDRQSSAPVGIWSGTVSEQYVPYVRPQNNGNKEGVRWLSLTDATGRGMLIVAEDMLMSATAIHFAERDLAAASHSHELVPRAETVLSLDARMSGLGNSSAGPGMLAKYAVPPERYVLRYSMREAQTSAPAVLAADAREKLSGY